MSSEAHAELVSIDVRAALAIEGVLAVYTADDFAEYPDLPGGMPDLERPVLARNTVRFVGEPIAIVVAEDRYLAADAAQAVVVEYSSLPVMTTIASATAAGAAGDPSPPRIERRHDRADDERPRARARQAATSAPTCESSTSAARRCRSNRSPAWPQWTPDGLTMWATFQAPHHLRNYLSTWLDVPQTQCRVIAPDVGGGFGSKIVWYPELFVAPVIAKLLRRPVKFAQTRSEAMLQMAPGRDQEHEIDVGFDRDGKIKALRTGGHPEPRRLPRPHRARPARAHHLDGGRRLPDRRRADLVPHRHHQHHAGRCVSRRRTSRGGVLDRTHRRRRGAPHRARPGRGAAPQLHPAVGVPLRHPQRPGRVRLGQLPGRPRRVPDA